MSKSNSSGFLIVILIVVIALFVVGYKYWESNSDLIKRKLKQYLSKDDEQPPTKKANIEQNNIEQTARKVTEPSKLVDVNNKSSMTKSDQPPTQNYNDMEPEPDDRDLQMFLAVPDIAILTKNELDNHQDALVQYRSEFSKYMHKFNPIKPEHLQKIELINRTLLKIANRVNGK